MHAFSKSHNTVIRLIIDSQRVQQWNFGCEHSSDRPFSECQCSCTHCFCRPFCKQPKNTMAVKASKKHLHVKDCMQVCMYAFIVLPYVTQLEHILCLLFALFEVLAASSPGPSIPFESCISAWNVRCPGSRQSWEAATFQEALSMQRKSSLSSSRRVPFSRAIKYCCGSSCSEESELLPPISGTPQCCLKWTIWVVIGLIQNTCILYFVDFLQHAAWLTSPWDCSGCKIALRLSKLFIFLLLYHIQEYIILIIIYYLINLLTNTVLLVAFGKAKTVIDETDKKARTHFPSCQIRTWPAGQSGIAESA